MCRASLISSTEFLGASSSIGHHSSLLCAESLSHSFDLQQMVTEPTHVHYNGSETFIDLVFVSNPVLTNSCPPLSNSDHNGVLVQCSWKPTARQIVQTILKAALSGATIRLTG